MVQFDWKITENEINQTCKSVNGVMQPMNQDGVDKLAKAIDEVAKDENGTAKDYYSFERNVKENDTGGRNTADLDYRKQEIFRCEQSFESFLMYYFKKHGLKNVFDKPMDRFSLKL